MKKVVLNISDSIYERFRLEAMTERKDIRLVIKDRLMYKPFSQEIEQYFDKYIEHEIQKIMKE